MIHTLNENNYFLNKKVYLLSVGDSVFDLSMMHPSLQYPFDKNYPDKVKLKPLPVNFIFLRSLLAKTVNPEDQKAVHTLLEQFPELRRHIVACPTPGVISLFEGIADVVSQHVGSR